MENVSETKEEKEKSNLTGKEYLKEKEINKVSLVSILNKITFITSRL